MQKKPYCGPAEAGQPLWRRRRQVLVGLTHVDGNGAGLWHSRSPSSPKVLEGLDPLAQTVELLLNGFT